MKTRLVSGLLLHYSDDTFLGFYIFWLLKYILVETEIAAEI